MRIELLIKKLLLIKRINLIVCVCRKLLSMTLLKPQICILLGFEMTTYEAM